MKKIFSLLVVLVLVLFLFGCTEDAANTPPITTDNTPTNNTDVTTPSSNNNTGNSTNTTSDDPTATLGTAINKLDFPCLQELEQKLSSRREGSDPTYTIAVKEYKAFDNYDDTHLYLSYLASPSNERIAKSKIKEIKDTLSEMIYTAVSEATNVEKKVVYTEAFVCYQNELQ
jgi:hypothetical protein